MTCQHLDVDRDIIGDEGEEECLDCGAIRHFNLFYDDWEEPDDDGS